VDASACFAWGRALERFLAGDLPAAERELKRARRANRFIELYLTDRKNTPERLPDSYELGSDEEAILFMVNGARAWIEHPEALFWLSAQVAGVKLPPEQFQRKLFSDKRH
jgi:hypothetical protein